MRPSSSPWQHLLASAVPRHICPTHMPSPTPRLCLALQCPRPDKQLYMLAMLKLGLVRRR